MHNFYATDDGYPQCDHCGKSAVTKEIGIDHGDPEYDQKMVLCESCIDAFIVVLQKLSIAMANERSKATRT